MYQQSHQVQVAKLLLVAYKTQLSSTLVKYAYFLTWHCPFALLEHRVYSLYKTRMSLADILSLIREYSIKVA